MVNNPVHMWAEFCNLLPYICCIFGNSFATYLDNIWDMVAVPWLHEDCQPISFYNALVAMGNIRYILPECSSEQYIYNMFVLHLQKRLIQLCLTSEAFAILVTYCECAICNPLTIHSYLKNDNKSKGCFWQWEKNVGESRNLAWRKKLRTGGKEVCGVHFIRINVKPFWNFGYMCNMLCTTQWNKLCNILWNILGDIFSKS